MKAQAAIYLPLFYSKTLAAAVNTHTFEFVVQLKNDTILKRVYASCRANLASGEILPLDILNVQINNFEENFVYNQPEIAQFDDFASGVAIQNSFIVLNTNENFINIDFKNGLFFRASSAQNFGCIITLYKSGTPFPIGCDLSGNLFLEFENPL